MRAAIDFGISNTDVVAYVDGELRRWNQPSRDQPPDPEFARAMLAAGGVELASLGRLAVTGGRHRSLPPQIEGCTLVRVGEIEAIGRGGQALAGGKRDDPLLVVSAGSGTALVTARGAQYAHVTGSGVGGGTLIGLSRLLLHTADPGEIDALALAGDPTGTDLSLSDVINGQIGNLPPDATAVNFGRLAHHDFVPRREDMAAALVTLVGQVIAIVAINAANAQQIERGLDTVRIVVIGHLTDMSSIRRVLGSVGDLYGVRLNLPPEAGHATALGALLHSEEAE
jgi:type II pantothenate kinase